MRPEMATRLRGGAANAAASLGVIAIALLLGIAIVSLAGYPIGATVEAMWTGAFVGSQSIDATLQTTIPLVLSALAWIVAFRAGRINLGIEGQILAGGVAATLVGLYVDLPTAIHLPLTVAAAAAGGALYAGIAAALWAWRGVNEIIATFMLYLIAVLLVAYLATGPLQEPTHQQPISATIPDSARWPSFFGQVWLSWDIILIPIGVALVAWVLSRTTAGFRLRITGANPEAARHAGISVVKVGALAMIASGAIAGLAASSLLLSSQGGALQVGFSSSVGFYGIAIALLARNAPWRCIPAAILFAALQQGGGLAQAEVGVSTALIDVTFGIIVILVSASAFFVEQGKRTASKVRLRPLQRRRVSADVSEGSA
jgi:general nucleoside transport system permease protein